MAEHEPSIGATEQPRPNSSARRVFNDLIAEGYLVATGEARRSPHTGAMAPVYVLTPKGQEAHARGELDLGIVEG